MAPVAVEQQAPVLPPAPVRGPLEYKIAFNYGPKAYSKENEEKGSERHAPAAYPHYLPTWSPKT